MRALVMLTAIAPLSATTAMALAAEPQQARWHVAIERGELGGVLAQLAQQVSVDLARFSDLDTDRIIVGPLAGDYTREEALEQLLRDTALTYRFVNEHTVAIVRRPCPESPAADGLTASHSDASGAEPNNQGRKAVDQTATSSGNAAPGANRLWSWVAGIFGADKSKGSRRGAQARASALAIVCGTAALASGARVQAAETAAAESVATLEEVTVTAQRREENLQKVPIAVDIVSGEDAELRGATSIQTLSATVPSLVNVGSFYSHTYIRGVGANNGSPNNEPSAATYIDGVYMPSSFALFGSFNNVERIEVLKGPQGTLFGRNTTGGVIQIVTADPQHTTGGSIDVGYANYDTISANGYLTGGISENLAADVAVLYENQAKGWGTNLTRGTEIYKHYNLAARSKWLYTPSDATRMTVSLDFVNYNFTAGLGMLPGSINPADTTITYAGRFNAYGDPTVDHAEQYGAAVRLDHDFSRVHATSITSYRHVQGYEFHDNDRVPARRSYVQAYNFADYGMQEFQLSNLNPGRITWLIGSFIYGNTVDANDPRIESGSTVTPGQYREVYGKQFTRSYSLYGQATGELTSRTKLTLGLRYTSEDLKLSGKYLSAAGALLTVAGLPSPYRDKLSFSPMTWRLALDHQFTPDVLGYVSYNHGFKSGGYNLATPERASFLPEKLDAYELGVKSELMNHRIRLNAAMFYYDYKDIQVVIVPGGAGQIFTNAAAARNYGLDASLEFAATDHMTLAAGLGLLNAKYKDYPNAQGNNANGTVINIANAKDRSLAYAPPLSGYVSANYRVPTAAGEFRGSATVSYVDKYYINPAEIPVIGPFTMISAAVEWRSNADKSFGVRLWGRNLGNEYVGAGTTASTGGWYSSYAAPRTYGVNFLKDF